MTARVSFITAAIIVAIGTGLAQQAGNEPKKPSLKGVWTYRSYLVDPEGPKAQTWAPRGQLKVETDPDGKLEGELTFKPGIAFKVTGKLGRDSSGLAPFEATAKGFEGTAGVSYELKGWLVPDGSKGVVERTIVRGSVVNPGPDLAKQPPGTVGAFILEPASIQ
jgi:hypothetical protein